MSKTLAIGAMNLRRFARDRMSLFYVFVLPVAIILVIGVQFGSDDTPRLGVVGGSALGDALLDELATEHDVEIERVGSEGSLTDQVDAQELDAGIVLEEGAAEIGFLAARTTAGEQLRTAVDSALASVLAVPTSAAVVADLGADPDAAREAAERLAATVEPLEVRTVTAGDRLFPEDLGAFDIAAPSQLVLFTFITGLTGAAALIQTRQLRISARMLVSPTPLRAIVAGEAFGRWLVGIVQAVYIVAVTAIVFGVGWGDPVGVVALVVVLAAVSAGAAMCFGTFFDDPEQASGIGVVTAIGLAALGGAMLPVELFSDTLRTVAKVTPHYWAIDAYAELIRHDRSILDIGSQLAVLTAYAAGLLLVATWRMRVVLTR